MSLRRGKIQAENFLFLLHNMSREHIKMLKSGKIVCLYIYIAFFITLKHTAKR